MVTKSKVPAYREDDGFDELANALIDDSSTTIERSSSHSRVQHQALSSNRSCAVTPERTRSKSLNKPLPSLPPLLLQDVPLAIGSPIHDSLRSEALHVQKSKKSGLSPNHIAKTHTSNPVRPSAGSRSASTQSSTLQVSRPKNENISPSTSTTDAAALSRKLTDLMQKAAASSPQVLMDRPKMEKDVKRTPLQRGKEVLTKAKRAIAGRLSSSQERQGRIKLTEEKYPYPSLDKLDKGRYSTGEDANQSRLDRRLAEGSNLSITKIQEVLGDGKIRRKPLPVYEKMKAKRMSASLHDPFSDRTDKQASPTADDFSTLWLDYKKAQSRRASTSSFGALLAESQTVTDASNGRSPTETDAASWFSEKISGLSQHPDTASFSSSPVDFSTPRVRLRPQSDAHGRKRLTVVLTDDPETPNSSLDDLADSDHYMSAQEGTKLSTGSLKRKSGTQDLRSGPGSATKRPKKDLRLKLSTDDLALAASFKKLETRDQVILSPKDRNIKIRLHNKAVGKVKGLGIFETNKPKLSLESMSSMVNMVNRPHGRPSGKQSSIPRPASIAYARDYRTYTPMAERFDDDTMALDELQTKDSSFYIGSKS